MGVVPNNMPQFNESMKCYEDVMMIRKMVLCEGGGQWRKLKWFQNLKQQHNRNKMDYLPSATQRHQHIAINYYDECDCLYLFCWQAGEEEMTIVKMLHCMGN
eukprot:13576480-Ditylum_brightwellii.AAC.1